MIVICIADNGVGIASQHLSDLFQIETSFPQLVLPTKKALD